MFDLEPVKKARSHDPTVEGARSWSNTSLVAPVCRSAELGPWSRTLTVWGQ
jgi:hypothetical protein